MTERDQSSIDRRSVIATNLEMLEELAWKAWRDGWRANEKYLGEERSWPESKVRAEFNLWWGWQAATLENGDWRLDR